MSLRSAAEIRSGAMRLGVSVKRPEPSRLTPVQRFHLRAASIDEHEQFARQRIAAERLDRAIASFMVVASRITHLMRTGRTCPDLQAALLFELDEIRGVSADQEKPPATPPTVNLVLRLIATLGSFLARKGDGEPGVKTIWLGLQRVMDAAATIQALRDETA